MKKLASALKWFIGIFALIVLIVVSSYVAVFVFEKDSAENIYLYNYAFVAEKEEDGLNMWVVKKTSFDELKTGDGVIYFSEDGYHAANFDGNNGEPMFYRADDLNEQVTVTAKSCVGQIIASW